MIRKLLMVVTLVIVACLVTLTVTSCSMQSSLKSIAEENERRRNEEWHEMLFFDVLDREDVNSMSEAAIKKAYVDEANKWKSGGPPKAEPSDEETQKVLNRLKYYGRVVKAPNGEWTSARKQFGAPPKL